MPPPKAIVCHLCNGKYFSRSWPIHLKACEAKWKKTHSRCEYCGVAVNNADWSDHRAHCKPSQKKKLFRKDAPLEVPKSVDSQQIPAANDKKVIECEECEAEDAMWRCQQCEQSLCAMCDKQLHRKGARARHIRDPLSAKALRAENLAGGDSKEKEDNQFICPPVPVAPKVDGRIECKFCHRKFNPQRAEKHMRICSKATKKLNKRKVYDGAKRRIEGTEFAQYQYNRSSTPEQVKKWRKEGRRWKEESNVLRQGTCGNPLDLLKLKMAVEKKMKFRIQGYGREAKDEENVDVEVIHPYADEKKKEGNDDGNDRNDSNQNGNGNGEKEQIQKIPSPKEHDPQKKRVFKKQQSARSGSDSTRSRDSAPSSGRFRGSTMKRGKNISTAADKRTNGGMKKNNTMSLNGSSSKMGQRSRPTSNTSSNNSVSSKGSARFNRKPMRNASSKRTVDSKGLNVKGKETTSTRVPRQRKKPGVPRFGRRQSTENQKQTTKPKVPSRKPTVGSTSRNPKPVDPPQPRNVRSSNPPNVRVERMPQENVNRVQKENNRKAQQPILNRAKSEAKSLPRGIELGVNVKKMQGDGPKSMDDYLERERLRRQQRKGMNSGKRMAASSKAMVKGVGGGSRQRKTSQMNAVTKKMSRLQIEQQKMNLQKSVQKIDKPTGSKDLASKRAAYYESLLQQQEE